MVEGSFSGVVSSLVLKRTLGVSVQYFQVSLNLFYLLLLITLTTYSMIDPDFTGEKICIPKRFVYFRCLVNLGTTEILLFLPR